MTNRKDGGWLPIETAPKNTPVLLWVSADDPHPMAEGYATGRLKGEIWWTDTNGTSVTPLKWQPLPPAPKKENDDG